MAIGYCSLDDVQRALLETDSDFNTGALGESNNQTVKNAIAAQTEWLEKTLSRHWYAPNGADRDSEGSIFTSVKSRDDEHDLPRHAGLVHGASERRRHQYRQNSDALLEAGPRHERRRTDYREPKQEIRLSFGDLRDDTVPAYTRLRLNRKDVQAVNELSVVNANGGYDDWVVSTDYSGGVGNTNRGEDYWVRVNNGGVSELYLDVHAMDDDLASLANAVYVDVDYGHEGVPRNVRQAVGFRAAAYLVEKAVIEIPSNATVYNIETKADEMRESAEELLEVYR
ncbi:MAG: hypothetical protein ABEH81_04035 [Halopenitus sp.]